MKKIILRLITLGIATTLSLAACGQTNPQSTGSGSQSSGTGGNGSGGLPAYVMPAPPAECVITPITLPEVTVNLPNANTMRTQAKMPGTLEAFKLSLNGGTIDQIPVTGDYYGVVGVGNYDPEGYNWRNRLALIQLNLGALANILPDSLRQNLVTQLGNGTTHDNLIARLNAIDTRVYMQGLGTVVNPADPTLTHAYNLVYHTWNSLWHSPNAGARPDDFIEATPMGVFQPAGVFTLGNDHADNISFDRFTARTVHYHHPAYSPNNAKIGTIPACNFSSFWAAAVSPDQQHVNLTYFLMAHNAAADTSLATIFRNSNSIANLQVQFAARMSPMAHDPTFNPAAVRTVQAWLTTLVQSLGM